MLRSWRQRRFEKKLGSLDPAAVRRESERLHGSLAIQGGTLYYSHSGAEVWSLPVGSLVLIGEHTTDRGPWFPDYSYVFIGGLPPRDYEAPMYANPEILRDLGSVLGATLVPGLADRTDFASRVIWPPQLAEQPLLQYCRRPRGGIWGLVADRVAPLIASSWSPSVRAYLDSRSTA